MNDTQHTPTDTEILDWVISKLQNRNALHGYFWIPYEKYGQTPRAAIESEMMKGKK
jgi:hypothetical protein